MGNIGARRSVATVSMTGSAMTRSRLMVAAVVLVIMARGAAAQTICSWSTSTASTAWATASNWDGGTFAGVGASSVTGEGTATDVAFRGSNSETTLGIDMGTLGGTLTLAAMDLDPSTTTLAIGNSSSSAAGILQLNGAVAFGTTSPITNSIIRANNAVTTSSATTTIQNAVGAGSQTLGLRLGTANGAIITAGSKTLALAVPLTELSPGSGFRKVGAGVLILQSPATLAGGTVSFEAGTLRITNTDALSGASGPVIRFNAGIGTATLGVGFNGELANAIDVPTGLVQQQLIQTSAAGTPTLSGVMTINFNTLVRHNQSSGTLTVSGTANTVASGATVSFATQTAGNVTDSALWSGAGTLAYGSTGTASTGSFFISGQKTHAGGSRINSIVGRAVVSTDSLGPANAPTSGPFGTGTVSLASGFKLRSGTAADVVIGNAVTVTATTTASRFTTATDEKSLTFTGDVTLGSVARTISVDTGSTVAGAHVAFNGSVSGTGGLTKVGAGTLVLGGSNSFTGSLTVQSGRLRLAHAAAAGSCTVVPMSGGTVALAPALQATMSGLSANAGGLIDAVNGQATVLAGLSATDMVTAILSGRGDGSWNGASGITSSVAAASGGDRTVGWLDNGDGSVTFGFAAAGDSNLDWMVDIIDAANFLAGGMFDVGPPASWMEGDYTYDGFVDILDAAVFLSNGLFDAGFYNSAPGASANAMVAVPEPAGLAVIAVAALAMYVRSRVSPFNRGGKCR